MAKEKKRYSYHVKDANDNYAEGTILATSAEALKANFEKRGFKFLDEPVEVANEGLNTEINIGIKKGVKPREVAAFARKFSNMQNAGIPLSRILQVLSASESNTPKMKEALADLQEHTAAGGKLATGLAKHPEIFSELVVSMVAAGEEAGFLDKALRQVQENLDAEIKLKSKIKSAMTYPVVVLIMAMLMCTGMLLFIVPIFAEMFDSLGGELPLPTKILQQLSNFLKVGIVPIIIALVAFSFWWKKNKRQIWVREIMDPLALKIPVFGKLTAMIVMSRFARNLGTLLDNGVPIVRSMEIVGATTGSIVVEKALAEVRADLVKGEKIGDALAKHEFFPMEDVEMIKVGDDSGDIAPMLTQIGAIYDEDVEATTDALTSLIEPLMLVFLGVVVGGMIIALYMPIFSIYDAIKQS